MKTKFYCYLLLSCVITTQIYSMPRKTYEYKTYTTMKNVIPNFFPKLKPRNNRTNPYIKKYPHPLGYSLPTIKKSRRHYVNIHMQPKNKTHWESPKRTSEKQQSNNNKSKSYLKKQCQSYGCESCKSYYNIPLMKHWRFRKNLSKKRPSVAVRIPKRLFYKKNMKNHKPCKYVGMELLMTV